MSNHLLIFQMQSRRLFILYKFLTIEGKRMTKQTKSVSSVILDDSFICFVTEPTVNGSQEDEMCRNLACASRIPSNPSGR